METIITKIYDLFNDPKLRGKLLTYRWPLTIAILTILALLMKPQYFWLGLFISLAGETLQVWCFAALHKKKELAITGPYAAVRNPMYIGRYFLILGVVTITGNLFLMIIFSIIYYFYMVNRVGREEVVLKEIFAEAYQEYCNRTNRFIPAWQEVDKETICYFRWNLFFKNNAHLNLLSVIVGYLIVYSWLF
ncbi:MAG: isoprenylcysteine carboxylmethyltransferase family protein [Deltaproteobacteria bacterium]|nr:isoprenylcysteine carboxylmethyltransferase family protein [Candidatus Tharpella aukensis]